MNIRLATMEDRDAIKQLIAGSARHLSREHYSDKQIEAAIVTVFGVDTDLIEDGTYFVAEDSGAMIGCGGWSKRKTLFGGDQYASRDAGYLDPASELFLGMVRAMNVFRRESDTLESLVAQMMEIFTTGIGKPEREGDEPS